MILLPCKKKWSIISHVSLTLSLPWERVCTRYKSLVDSRMKITIVNSNGILYYCSSLAFLSLNSLGGFEKVKRKCQCRVQFRFHVSFHQKKKRNRKEGNVIWDRCTWANFLSLLTEFKQVYGGMLSCVISKRTLQWFWAAEWLQFVP